MKQTVTTNNNWLPSSPDAKFLQQHSQDAIKAWESLTARVMQVAQANGWNKSNIAKRADVPDATFSQWSSGKYLGTLTNINEKIANWLDALEASQQLSTLLPVSPAYQLTSVGQDVYNTLLYTQISHGFTAVTLPAGSGKTRTAQHFCATRPHAYMATLSPNTKNVHGMLIELASELDVQEYNPARLVRAIGKKLQRVGEGTILIVDEAQNAVPDAINQLRHFVDNYRCGIALLGNEATATAFVRDQTKSVASRAQVLSRFDKIVKRERDPVGDAKIMINAWGVTEPDCVTFLLGIASKAGALRQIDRTMKGAMLIALGEGEEQPTLKHLKAAWKDRDLGDVL